MAATIDLTARWVGHYWQNDGSHGITADLVQVDTSIVGTMTDRDTHREQSVFDTAVEAGLPPGADEQIIVRLREAFPEAPRGPIRYTTELPSCSMLNGDIQGRTVSFIKTYQGEHRSGYRIGDQFVGATVEQHQVHYRGQLSADGLEIDGLWWIPADRERGSRRTEGRFLIRREAASA